MFTKKNIENQKLLTITEKILKKKLSYIHHRELLYCATILEISSDQLEALYDKLKETAFFYDLDGVLYNIQPEHLEKSRTFVNLMNVLEIPQMFVTNNPRFLPEVIITNLIDLGYHVRPQQLITCGVAASYEAQKQLKERGLPSTVTVHGTPDLIKMMEKKGMKHVQKGDKEYPPSVYVAGELPIPTQPDRELLEEMMYLGQNCPVVIVTNPDEVVTTKEHGTVVCVGEWGLKPLSKLRNDIVVTGKPKIEMLKNGFDMLCDCFGRSSENIKRIIFTGDTLNTDIVGANAMNEQDLSRDWIAVLIKTGNTQEIMDVSSLKRSEKPQYIIDNFGSMLESVIFED